RAGEGPVFRLHSPRTPVMLLVARRNSRLIAMHPTAWNVLLTRRDALRVGSLAVAARALPAVHPPTPPTPNPVLLLSIAAASSNIHSYDHKLVPPAEVRGDLNSIATTLPGVRFCETMPCLAQQTQRFALIRSFASGNDDHFLSQAYALSGRRVNMTQITTE